ncbi:cyclic nucleotide-binding domain-containing protein [Streptomyces sp. L2]|uniref:Crp/Fnr family transcriptional regulator n=1 Tax=Streptomyces sp. L2 TaxID=2162665 RepID=UPI0010135CDB|nr:cyclic nucleotide-binding domain-containing protein [Streptomyces sp. L2]
MTITATSRMSRTLPVEYRSRLMSLARDVSFPQSARLFEEGAHADRFWVVRSGAVALDMRVPGRRPVVIETLGFGELVGCSWLFPPGYWTLGAEAMSPVRAYEFDAAAVREMCRAEPALGALITYWAGQVLAHRLQATRVRLLDLFGPYGSGHAA